MLIDTEGISFIDLFYKSAEAHNDDFPRSRPLLSFLLLIVFLIYSCLVINEENAHNCLHRFPAIWSGRKELEVIFRYRVGSIAQNKFHFFFSDFLIRTFYCQIDTDHCFIRALARIFDSGLVLPRKPVFIGVKFSSLTTLK